MFTDPCPSLFSAWQVLEKVQAEFLDCNGSGSNVMGKRESMALNDVPMIVNFPFVELSHRSNAFAKIIQDAERDIREIL